MRILFNLAIGIAMASATAAQEVAPASVAAVEMGDEGWSDAQVMAQAVDPLTSDVVAWLLLRAGAATRTHQKSEDQLLVP